MQIPPPNQGISALIALNILEETPVSSMPFDSSGHLHAV